MELGSDDGGAISPWPAFPPGPRSPRALGDCPPFVDAPSGLRQAGLPVSSRESCAFCPRAWTRFPAGRIARGAPAMPLPVLGLVLASAVIHATWNLWTKQLGPGTRRASLLWLLTAISSVAYAPVAWSTIAATHWRPDATALA